jgi:peptide/nickel transport system substrate-binding protein
VTVDLLKRLDLKVDFAAVDWGTVIARRLQKSPPRQGGWQMSISGCYGVDFADPSSRSPRTNGNEVSNGWANNPQIQVELAAWYDATSLDEEKTSVRRGRRSSRLRTARSIPATLYVAQECHRHCASAAAPFLGRQQTA